MLNINFVPDDYVKSSESRRTNWMYLLLFAVVMTGLGGSFVTIKMRQRAITAKEEYLSTKAAQAQEAIEQFEALQTRRKVMLKTALTIAELLKNAKYKTAAFVFNPHLKSEYNFNQGFDYYDDNKEGFDRSLPIY